MPEKEEDRKEIRMPLESVLSYNVLKDATCYIREKNPASAIFKKPDSIQDLNANDPFEALLIHMNEKLDYLIELLSEKIGRKVYQHQARTTDISAEGLCFVTSDTLPEDALLEIGLVLPSQSHRSMDIAAKVVRQAEYMVPGTKKRLNKVGVIFTDILPEDQDSIVHYIFQKQREEIRSQKNEF